MPINSTYSKAVDGAKTLQENMADNGGVSSAYDAWKLASDSGEALNVKLSGLEKFSLEQIFFIAFGQANCANYKQASLELSVCLSIAINNRWIVMSTHIKWLEY